MKVNWEIVHICAVCIVSKETVCVVVVSNFGIIINIDLAVIESRMPIPICFRSVEQHLNLWQDTLINATLKGIIMRAMQ